MAPLDIKFGKPPSRRELRWVKQQEAEMYAEVRAFMDKGLSFDDAWIASGGLIVPLTETPSANVEEPK